MLPESLSLVLGLAPFLSSKSIVDVLSLSIASLRRVAPLSASMVSCLGTVLLVWGDG